MGNLVDPETGQNRELPWAWSELRLCRDVYHCTPEDLDRQDWNRIQQHIAIMNLEAEAEDLRNKHASKK